MKAKDRKEIKKMIDDAMQQFIGDIAEYINYYNTRLEVIEDKVGIEVDGYVEHLGHIIPITKAKKKERLKMQDVWG